MEKYKKFTDAATGINPFVPFKRKTMGTPAILKFIVNPIRAVLVSPILFIVRFLLLSIMVSTLALLTIAFSLIPVWVIRRPLEKYLQFLACRVILAVLGVYYVNSSTVNSKGRIQENSITDWIKEVTVGLGSGDVIVANHMSYIDTLYLAHRYAPVFATLVKKEKSEGFLVVRQNLVGAVLHDIFSTPLASAKKEKLVDLVKYARDNHLGPVVVYPEGTTSNGFSTLKFQDSLFDGLADIKPTLHALAIKYEYTQSNPAFHLDNFWGHLYETTSQLYTSLNVKYIQLSESEKKETLSNSDVNSLRSVIGSALGTKQKLVSLSYKDKETFMEYWCETQTKDYAKKDE